MKTKHWLAAAVFGLAGLAATLLNAEEKAVLKADRVNVRGQASLSSEVITQLRLGEPVVVLEEVTLEEPKPGEPAKWARIALPANTPVWVHGQYIDANKTVLPRLLNVRSGPGENYSVIGQLDRGAAVKEIRTVEGWMEIEPPKGTFGFVAAEFLTKPAAPEPTSEPVVAAKPAKPAKPAEPAEAKPAPPLEPITTVETIKPEPPPATVIDAAPALQAPTVIATPEPAPAASVAAPPVAKPAPVETERMDPPILPPVITPTPGLTEEPLPKRIVQREGVVRRTFSIQAPTPFSLEDPVTGKTINYLYTAETGLQLKYYTGKRISVSGEEAIDKRWPNTPLIEIKTLQPLP